MVTFSSDYWAPGLDVNVRRRASSKRTGAEGSNSNLPVLDSALVVPAISHLNNNVFSAFQDDSSLSDLSDHFVSSLPPGPKPHTKISAVKEKVPSGSNSNHGSESDFIGSVRNAWNGMLVNKLGRQKSYSSSGKPKEELTPSLTQKYGVRERRVLGKGATAVVRLAHKQSATEDSLFAVKAFRKRRKEETEREYVKKLTSEFCISSSLDHPNIVKTVDLIKDEFGDWCEVMEYCPGGDLYSVIRNGSMTRYEIDCCFKQLITGVNYLHQMGVAHRDIKPENLLIDETGRIKITDFGVSDVFKCVWESTSHKSSGLCGSEPYIAPEAFVEKDYDARLVDIWACGIVYYAMTYHGVPFRTATTSDSSYRQFLEQRENGKYEPFRKYTAGCRNLMTRILEPDVNKRITMEEILSDEWFKSIEVCINCETSSMHHCHHAANYVPPKPASPIPSQPATSPLI